MSTVTRRDLVKLGTNAVFDGRLSDLRTKTGLSRHAMARLIGVDPQALREWEQLKRMMTLVTAERVGEWLWAAEQIINDVEDPVDFTELIPGSGAAMMLTVPEEELPKHLKAERLKYEDLGVLGIFVYRTEIPALVF